MAAQTNDLTLALYRHNLITGQVDIAQEAYNDSLAVLKKQFQDNEQALVLLNSTTSIGAFEDEVKKAQRSYETDHPKSKCLEVLRKLSSRIKHYSLVLDMIAQHHPEYVALVWGTAKLVIVGIINHEKHLELFTSALVEIGDSLRSAKINAELYQTPRMRNAIAHLYAHIMGFFRQAVKWYTKSSLWRAKEAFLNPVELKYQDTVHRIQDSVRTINGIASACRGVEIRDINVLLQMKLPQLEAHLSELPQLREQLKKMQESLENRANAGLLIARHTHAMTKQVSIHVADMHPRIQDIQMASILSSLAPRQTPSRALMKMNSFTKRALQHSVVFKDSLSTSSLMSKLHTWASDQRSSLFVVRVGVRADMQAKQFAVDVINFLKQTQFPVLFSFSQQHEIEGVSLLSLFKSLIHQALQRFPEILTSDPSQLNVVKFASQHQESEWRTLVLDIFSKVNNCFVVVEVLDLMRAHRDDPDWVAKFMPFWHDLIKKALDKGMSLKIMVLSYAKDALPVEESGVPAASRIFSTIDTPMPVPARLRKTLGARVRMNRLRTFQQLRPGF